MEFIKSLAEISKLKRKSGGMDDIDLAKCIAYRVSLIGGKTYYVGGYVRDCLLGAKTKDIDIEIHNIKPNELREILSDFGEVNEFGKSFGVFSVKGFGLDISMPRTERKSGFKHTDFEVEVNPFIGIKEAMRRRDFTINAIYKDVISGEIIDYFDGQKDLNDGTIRHIDDKSFKEDSLRVFRAAQFASRFGFKVAHQTVELCKGIKVNNLSKERIETELKKALTYTGTTPSIFFETLREMEQLDYWFAELKQLIDVPQNPKFHPEGSVWNHTMEVIDKASEFDNGYQFMLSALCHDIGKIKATFIKDGIIHAYRHEEYLEDIESLLYRIVSKSSVKKYVINMCKNHMRGHQCFKDNSHTKKINKMFDDVISPNDFILLSYCDSSHYIYKAIVESEFLTDNLYKFNLMMEKPYVQGKDLIDAGFKPCKEFKEILDFAHKLRLAGIEKDKALPQVISMARKIIKRRTNNES